jgi:SNF2 family DNA or RNA helicase
MAEVAVHIPSERTHGTWVDYALRMEALRRRARREELRALKQVRVCLLPHQIEAAHAVIHRMGCRAILADEVGLGKTIEAGIVIKEMVLRGLVRSVLILTPASLTLQWAAEMREKFDMEFHVSRDRYGWREDRVIASIDLAKRPEHAALITSRAWDMVVVDEAHRLKNRATQNHRLVREIRKKYLLLLTATPVQNSLREIYNLIDLVKPGLLGTYRDFERRYFGDRKGVEVVNAEELRSLLSRVMVRHRRREVFTGFSERIVRTHLIPMGRAERKVYDALRSIIHGWGPEDRLRIISFQRAATSSPHAVRKMLWRALDREKSPELLELYAIAAGTGDAGKWDGLRRIVDGTDDKVLVFTSFVATQDYLLTKLADEGVYGVHFRGGMSAGEKADAMREFRERAQVMVATDAGAEGLNVQFARVLVNYDLPWNPMKVEQRIGRVHRIGQEKDVFILNLAYRDTVEEYILEILDRKINLFRNVVGELDMILGLLGPGRSLEAMILEVLESARTEEEVREGFRRIGVKLERVREAYERIKDFNEKVFERFDLAGVGGP